MARGKKKTAQGPGDKGRRVFKPKVSKANREKLKALYSDIVNYILGVVHQLNGSKCLAWYADEWVEMYENAKRMREEAGRRTPPKTPPLPMLVKFIMPDGTTRGNTAAPAVIDLRAHELRIPSYGVVERLSTSLVRALVEENNLNPRPEFTLQVTRRGFVRIIAQRGARSERAPLRVITLDENSAYGFTLAAWDMSADGTKVSLRLFEKLRPPNHGYRRMVASLLQSFADKPSEETKKRLAEILPEEVLRMLTTERAGELAAAIRARERRLNEAFVQRLAAEVRKLVREAVKRGMSVLILIDPINHESLKGTRLQGTLLRTRKRLQNLAVYEGATFRLVHASGRYCPRCGSKGEEIIHTRHTRIYECPRCHLRWDRDKAVHYNMIVSYFERLRREECDDDTALAERVLAALKEWLEEHPNALMF